MAFLKNLLGGKDKNFQIEIDQASSNPPATKPVATAKPAPAQAAKPVATPTAEAPSKKTKTFRTAKKEALAAVSQTVSAPASVTPPAPQPQPVAAVTVEPFAPKYLNTGLGENTSRRRPGANMSSFLEMARTVKR